MDNINELLQDNEVQVRIGTTWYMLDEIGPIGEDSFPIMVSDEDGESFEFDMADIDEFDPMFETFREMDKNVVGIA